MGRLTTIEGNPKTENSTKNPNNFQIRNNNKIIQTKQHNQVWQKEVLHGIRIQINKSTTDEIETFWEKNWDMHK